MYTFATEIQHYSANIEKIKLTYNQVVFLRVT